MAIAPAAFKKLVADVEQVWNVTDQTLYELCRNNPRHADFGGVCAKLWIIGRTFATGIERKVKTDGSQGGSMTRVAKLFHKNATLIDAWFDELRTIPEPLDPAKCQQIVSIHGRLVRLIRPLTRDGQSTRSFASKYMHFHNPIVPIFDNLASSSLRKLERWNNDMGFKVSTGADEGYAYYVMRFLHLSKQLQSSGVRATTRHLDYYLLSLPVS